MESTIKITEKVINEVAASFVPPILFAYVFGSSGTDLQNPNSDVDMAVYLDSKPAAVELSHKTALYAEISRRMERNDIDIVVLNTCRNQILLYEIMTRGRLIYDAGSGKRAVFEQKTLHAAIDFKEQRERIFG